MAIEQNRLEEVIHGLEKKVDECLDNAAAQHLLGDKQHANAEKLIVLAESLEADVNLLKGEMDNSEMGAFAVIKSLPCKKSIKAH